ncbi:hypothetical protein PPYR_08831 [Photinus pyralis]|uniref:Uncharacterized protein n=1 Tax=Photinus pyralis TaxID=7054 RepID=A0A1Y1LEY2_PHOPY|nr:probable multidrug resistance-associated protein lethal(2)03659 [Photinus pyralis]KAB0797838.1 hypothetical protein PPYR_08831 [Photinus pyralis]
MDLGLSKKSKPNPRERANILSIATISYTIPTFSLGYKKDIEVSDLYETFSGHQSQALGDRIEELWGTEETLASKSKRKPSLGRVLVRMFGLSYLKRGILCLIIEFVARIFQPLLLGELITYFSPGQTTMTKNEAYGYAGGVVACSLLQVLILAPYILELAHIGMKMRVACCSLVYRKALKLSRTALGETTVGQMVNLLSNDVNRFDSATLFAQYLVVGPLQAGLATYLMYREVGISAVIGVSASFLFIAGQFVFAKFIAKLRNKTAYRTDERVRLMNEVVTGIQVIKMYTWEKPFAKFVAFIRRNEIKYIRSASYIRGMMYSFFLFSTQFSLFVSILTYVLFGNHISARKVFVLTSLYNVIRINMYNIFTQAVAQVSEALVSITRLNEFLRRSEKSIPLLSNNRTGEIQNSSLEKVDAIEIGNGIAKWNEFSSDNVFENLNLRVKQGSVVAIIGPVGSGKSSLLQLILKELPLSDGQLKINGNISYASQEPWLFTGTVRKNILFNNDYNRTRYKDVVKKCSLKRDLSLLPHGDVTVVGERGISLSGGQRARINLARAVYQDADIYLLDDPLSAVDTHVARELFDRCVTGFLRGKTVILVTHQLQFLKDVDKIIIIEQGAIKAEGTFEELQGSGLDFAKLLNVDEEQKAERVKIARQNSISSTTSFEETIQEAIQENEEQRSKGTVSVDVYRSYIHAGTNWFVVFIVLFLFVASQTAVSFGDVFLSRWVTVEENRYNGGDRVEGFWNFSTDTFTYIYIGIIAATVTFAISRSLMFFTVCMKSSIKLHDNMFESISRATMRFFNTNPSGRIFNRFSKDMGAIDELLPIAMIDFFQIFLMLIGTIIVIITANVWLLIPTAVLAIIFYFLRRLYLTTSRNVKRLEGVTRSPVFGHLNASLQGLTTIRALRAESVLINEFDSLQDLHSTTWFLFIATSRAFAYWLDIVCVIYVALVAFSFLIIGDSTSGGNVGLAITQSMGLLGFLQLGVRQSAEVENQMTAVERVLEYNKIEHERVEKKEDKKPPKVWPEHGEVKFVDVYLSYFPEDPPVLKNLSFTIKPLEKIGIVGRTGAGKSSLINALFQLTDTDGGILIDGIDVKEVGLDDLRSRISIIPQEPVLFSGTMRKNLDPFDEYSDDVVWKSLEDVKLKHTIAELNLGLHSAVKEGGSNFSVGQRQLICLARAILRNNKILILDEATANVDPQTDALIQCTIRKQFAQCTVLTIAHRLNTIMDSDKVLVMDAGTMVEFDHPHLLLQNTNGILFRMVLQTGPSISEVLTKLAKESYERVFGIHQTD